MSGQRDIQSIDTLLFNPFLRLSDYKVLIAGVLAIVLAALIGSFSNAQFDGVLDIHITSGKAIWYFISLNVLNWILLTVVFLVLGAILTKSRFRIIDIVGTQAFARWPNVLSALATLLIKLPNVGASLPVIFSMQILITLSTCLMVTLMYNSYKISFDLKGRRLVISFIAGLLAAETASKIIIIYFLQEL